VAEPLGQVQRAFSVYAIERELGAGGMATVYLAHDKKHDRKVAIKILHAELAAVLGAERFLQEIRVTANLQHPHILGLIDSGVIGEGELQGRPYYVMPFIEGESVRQRLDKEQQLPVSDSVRIATEVASALDYAHRHNVIHRDIKPENILLHDGSAIVADFGIALAVTQAGGARMTQTGLSLGTPSYMSPEQAMGERTMTARSDIYSLGAVTYEMLSGEPPFTGPTVQAVVARVITEEPRPLTAQRRNVPPHVEAAVARALEKIPADRFASAHDFAEALNNPSFAIASTRATAVGPDRSTHRLRRMLYGVSALATLLLAIALWGWMRPAPPKPVTRYNITFDSAERISSDRLVRLALSPDGSRMAYVGGPRGQLLVRSWNELHATAIPETDGARNPFFSPDGQQVGFNKGGTRLQIVSLHGGPQVTVTDSLFGSSGVSWGPDGFLYARGPEGGLVRIEAKPGSELQRFTSLDTSRREFAHAWPEPLPNGKGVLFTIWSTAPRGISTEVAVADIPSGKHRVILKDAMFPRFAVSGHLLYVASNRTLMMVPFDQNSMKVTGEPTALVEGMRLGVGGATDLAVSETGTLVYSTSEDWGGQELTWVARDGKAQPVDSDWRGSFTSPSISADGKRLAVTLERTAFSQTGDIWIKQLDRGPAIKLTSDGTNQSPAWTPDGRSVTFASSATGSYDLWTKPADGTAEAVRQYHGNRGVLSARWSPDGKWLVFRTDRRSAGAGDVLGIRPGIDTAAVPLVATKFEEGGPALSPDGKWLAYVSAETGQHEVYVAPFPNTTAAKWAVSTRGGTEPLWSRNGKELFYRDSSSNLVAVEVKTNPAFSLGRSAGLFSAAEFRAHPLAPQYDVSPDGQRFLMIRGATRSGIDKLIVVENWFEELKEKSRK
jgi:serine/threonine protein kinase